MKIYIPKTIALFILSALFLVACGGGGDDKKEEEPTADTTKPTISFTVPTEEQSFTMGTYVQFKGTFTDETELGSVTFSLKDEKPPLAYGNKGLDDSPWKPDSETIDLLGKKTYDHDGNIFVQIPSVNVYTGFYTITILVKDKAGNEASETVKIAIN